MCGITGWIDWQRDLSRERPVVQAMTDTMANRGPDAEGIWLSRHAGIGHRRLAVIDLAGGVQPMVATETDGSRVLTYSGELYNFLELRKELRGRGHRFRTRSDTEVVLRSYLEWGADCVRRFNGMFAFAIWDESTEELLLARDRLGIKPLYYAELDGGLVFGSEIKAILAHPGIEAEVDADGLAELFCFTLTPGHAVYRGIHQLPAGRVARFDRTGYREHTYWRLVSEPHPDDEATTVGTVRDLLEDIVERQLVADVEVGSMLSGGVDSSTVTALATNTLAAAGLGPLTTYSVHFAGSEEHFQPSSVRPELDTPFARQMARHVGSKHHELLLETQSVFDAQREVLLAKDLPGLADINAAQYLLFRGAREECTVMLSGESADEVFGGYTWFVHEDLLTNRAFPWSGADDLMSVLSPEFHRQARPREYVTRRYDEAVAEVPVLDGEPEAEARVRRMFYLNLTRWLTQMLDQKDRMSMRTGLEVRVPFCDHRLVEYVWNVPWSVKSTGGRMKGLLREAARDLLPPEIHGRAKTAFPVAVDPLYDKETGARLDEELADPNSPLRPLVDAGRLRPLLHAEERAEPGVWRPVEGFAKLLQVAQWLRLYHVRLR